VNCTVYSTRARDESAKKAHRGVIDPARLGDAREEKGRASTNWSTKSKRRRATLAPRPNFYFGNGRDDYGRIYDGRLLSSRHLSPSRPVFLAHVTLRGYENGGGGCVARGREGAILSVPSRARRDTAAVSNSRDR
jgi:hypothetical protein